MKAGRKPVGKVALTNAQKQASYRLRLKMRAKTTPRLESEEEDSTEYEETDAPIYKDEFVEVEETW